MGLNRLAWRMLRARPLRSLLTVVGIALGVSVLAASLTLGAALDTAVDRTVRDLVGRADLRVSAFADSGLSEAAVQTVEQAPGVGASTAVVEHRTFLDATAAGEPGAAVTVLGIDSTYPALHPLSIASGVAMTPGAMNEALISQRLAAEDGFAIGSTITVLGSGRERDVLVVGIVSGTGSMPEAGRTLLVSRSLANATFDTVGATRIDLQVAAGSDVASVTNTLADRMTEPYVLSAPADIARGLRASAATFEDTAALIAAITLFVGTFLIVNTLSMTVGERAREVGLLRLAGSSRGQVMRFVFAGALLLGVVGAALGIVLGAAAAWALAGAVGAATGLPAIIAGLDAPSALTAAVVGLGITVLAAIEPAMRAARISPIEALRARIDLPAVRRARLGWIALVFVAVAVLGLVAWPPAVTADGAARALAVYGVLLVATVATPFILRPMARVLGLPVMLVMRLEERLARGSLARDRSRTALTLGSLVVGLAMIVALGWSAEATRAAATAWLEDVIPGDEVVSSIRPVRADEGVESTLAALPGVARVTPIGTFDLAYRGYRIDAAAVVGADLLADGRLQAVSGDRVAALTALDVGGSVILPAAVADRLGLGVGDTMSVLLAGGGHADLVVKAIVARSIPASGGEAILVGWGDATRRLGLAGADAFAVRFTPSASAADRDRLAAAATELALSATPVADLQGAVSDSLARIFGLFELLAIVAVVIATLGIVNTLTMSVLERIRELGLLRAIGMSRRQASRIVVVEAALLGIVGVVLGIATGLAVGAVMVTLAGGLTPAIGLPWLPIGIVAVLGLGLPILASIYPSRLAARVSIVEALTFD